jgi:putative ABC transport system permease protein
MLGLLDSIAFDALPYVILSFGLVLTFRFLKVLDLTFAATFSGAPAVAAFLLVQGASFASALAAAAAFAIAAASLTLAMMRFLALDGLLAGLLTSLAGFAVALLFTQGTLSLGDVATPFTALQALDFHVVAGQLALHPAQIAAFAGLALIAKLLVDGFLQSELGLALRAMEDEASRGVLLPSLGISQWRLLAIGLIGGNLLCAVSGLLIMLREGQVTASRGFDSLITVVAAYLLGTVLFERRPNERAAHGGLARLMARLARFSTTTATALGVVFYFLLLTIVLRLDLPASTPKLVLVGLVLLAFGLRRWADAARGAPPGHVAFGLAAGECHIRIEQIRASYPGIDAPTDVLRGFSADLPVGKLSQLVGSNGSGKSTLLKVLAGQVRGQGRMLFPQGRRPPGPREVAYVSQDAAAGSSATLSVAENLALFTNGARARFWRRWRPVSVEQTPAPLRPLAKAARDLPARTLSGGQRQALAIASLILRPGSPSLVLFDEPLTHLDEENAGDCVRLIRQLLSDGRTILLVQHDVNPTNVPPSLARVQLADLLVQTIDIHKAQGAIANEEPR